MKRDPRIEELLQQELDGANTAAESAELARLLEADPTLQAEYDRLRALAGSLDAVETPGPDTPLWPEVASAIGVGRAAKPRPERRSQPARRWWSPRMASAFAAGLAVGLIGLLIVTGGKPLSGDERPYGSVGVAPPQTRVLAQSPWWVRGEGLQASVKAITSGDLIAVTVVVDVGEGVTLKLTGEDGQSLIGWQSGGGHVRAVTAATGGEFHWSQPDRATVWLRHPPAVPGRLSVQLDHGDRTETRVLGEPPTGR